MKRSTYIVCTTLMMVAVGVSAFAEASPSVADSSRQEELFSTVSKLDADLFDTLDHCASPDQLQKHASYFAPNLEFYHDTGGVTWSRRDYMENTRNHVCGQFRRVLIPGSFQVFPIKDYGALEQGNQKFCWIASGKCFGEGQFLILWQHQDSHWVVTRAFSYGHHPIK